MRSGRATSTANRCTQAHDGARSGTKDGCARRSDYERTCREVRSSRCQAVIVLLSLIHI